MSLHAGGGCQLLSGLPGVAFPAQPEKEPGQSSCATGLRSRASTGFDFSLFFRSELFYLLPAIGCDVGHTAPSSTASRGACRALSLSDTKSYRRLCRFVYVNILCILIMAFSIFGRGYIDYTFINVLCIYAFHSLIGRPAFLCI